MERNTKQRAAIQHALKTIGRPLLPQEILSAAQVAVPKMSIATVYRNLKSMVEGGELQSVNLPGDATRYELHKHHHHHFHCNECSRVFDIHACPDDLSKLMPRGYQLEQHELTLYGKCADCNV